MSHKRDISSNFIFEVLIHEPRPPGRFLNSPNQLVAHDWFRATLNPINALGELSRQVVFVGGATTTLYIDDPAAPASVATTDTDYVVEISGILSLEKLEKKLRILGFKQPADPPSCKSRVANNSQVASDYRFGQSLIGNSLGIQGLPVPCVTL
jgi:hypothetical protein